MGRTIEEMTKTERRKVLASVGAFTIGNSVSTRPKDSVNCHPSVLWGCTAWASCLQLLIEGSPDAVSWPRSCPVAHGTEQSREWQEASFHGRERVKVRGLQPAVWARPLEFTVAAILVMVPNMSLVKRDFLSSCPCREREGLWTSAHQGTCLMKVTLPVLWTWNNCKLSIYKWSLLNPILHECWNACTTYKAESCWLRNIGL